MLDSDALYETHAHEFLQRRDASDIGAQKVGLWCKSLVAGARCIELGCGAGYPITRVLAQHDLQLWAIDASPTLVSMFRSRFPDVPIRCERVQQSDFFDQRYDAVIAVGLLFLLKESDQALLISRISTALVEQGRCLISAPVETGSWKDSITGGHCQSLGKDAYIQLFESQGLSVLSTFVDSGGNNYYDLRKQ